MPQESWDDLRSEQLRLREALEAQSRFLHEIQTRLEALDQRLALPSPDASAAPSPPPPPPLPDPQQPEPNPAPAPSAQRPEPEPVLPSPKPRPTKPARNRGDLELQLGTVWFVRIGVGMLLTGLVFLIRFLALSPEISASLKAGGLYVMAAAVTGAGFQLERRDSLRSYARVLIGAGFAALYTITYAIHHVALLRIVESPVIAGLLLLLCALGIFAFAAKRHSQSVAIVALCLAYYSSLISPVDSFALLSCLLLTTVALVFFVRSRWAAVGFFALFATYSAFAFWQYVYPLFGPADAALGLLSTRSAPSQAFLVCYWVLFTAAVFLPRRDALPMASRALFAGVNNAAFLALFIAGLASPRDEFWVVGLVGGGVLIGLSLLARRVFAAEGDPLVDTYLVKGIALLTAGFVAKLQGFYLPFLLALETLVLLVLDGRRRNRILSIVALAAAILATGALVHWLTVEERPFGWLLGVEHGLLLGFASWLSRRRRLWQQTGEAPDAASMPAATCFAMLALTGWAAGSVWGAAEGWPLLLLVVPGLALGLGTRFLSCRLPELLQLAQLLAVPAIGWALFRDDAWMPWFCLAPAAFLAFWNRSRHLPVSPEDARRWEAVYSFLLVGLVLTSFTRAWATDWAPFWPVTGGLLAIAATLLGMRFRMKTLVFASKAFHVAAVIGCGVLAFGDQSLWFILLPIASICIDNTLLRRGARLLRSRLPDMNADADRAVVSRTASTLHVITWIQGGLAVLLVLLFLAAKFPTDMAWMLALTGTLHATLMLRLFQDRLALVFSCLLIAIGLLIAGHGVLESGAYEVRPRDLIAAVAPLAVFGLLRRPGFENLAPLRTGLAIAGLVSIFVYLSFEVPAFDRLLTPVWAVYAFLAFAAGLLARERVFRLGGLLILATAIVRILTRDVWLLPLVPRFLSFFAIGGVLVLLGFFYNRFQETIRKYL